jgi:2-succinyl-5-enolpyruvyl-6-hydroxy-3-cyclohexene-1-carboxylate synthase
LEPTDTGQLQARLMIEELIRCGVRRFCLSPGSRNTHLLLAATANELAETRSFIDERAAAFFALGLAKATGEPAVLICTSGTAVANYLPTVIEASQSSTPLIILSADRPVELRNTGANQTIDQVNIFGKYTRWFHDLPVPDPATPLDMILTVIDRMVISARSQPAGPVHLNCQFAEPMVSERDRSIREELPDSISSWLESKEPFSGPVSRAAPHISGEIDPVKRLIRSSERGVIVAGQLDGDPRNRAILDLATRLKMPLLADISSGLRFSAGDHTRLATHYDHYLRDGDFASDHTPDLVIHLGGPLVSRALIRYLESSSGGYIRVDQTPFSRGPGSGATGLRMKLPPWLFCELCPTATVQRESTLNDGIQRAERCCASILTDTFSSGELCNEQAIPWRLLQELPAGSAIFLGNSMPVRDADSCGITLDHSVRVGVNRGASGIDGTIATALGFACGLDRPTLLLLGDLALIHDLNSLLLLAKIRIPLILVLVNNDGGGIFSSLSVARFPEHFEECFGTPHGLEFSSLAGSLGIPHFQPENLDQLREMAARDRSDPGGPIIIEIRTDRKQNAEEHRRLSRRVALALRNLAG